MSDIATVYAVFGSRDEAERIGEAMIEQRLAACVNILGPAQSIYRWDGKIERAEEVPALFKTTRDAANQLIAAIADAHSYDLPAICLWPIDRTLAPYADWINSEID